MCVYVNVCVVRTEVTVHQDQLLSKCGCSTVAEVLHGCSGETVKRMLQNEKVKKSKISWRTMLKFHSDIVMDTLAEELAAGPYTRGVWKTWYERLGGRPPKSGRRSGKSPAAHVTFTKDSAERLIGKPQLYHAPSSPLSCLSLPASLVVSLSPARPTVASPCPLLRSLTEYM